MSPFNAFLFLQGLETLSLRMARHVENAAAVAAFSPLTSWRPTSPIRAWPRAATGNSSTSICRSARGGVLVRLPRRPGRGTGFHPWRDPVVAPRQRRRCQEPDHHPASTTHRQLSDDELRAAGVGPGTIRLSIGIEAVGDLIWDLEQGFARARATATSVTSR